MAKMTERNAQRHYYMQERRGWLSQTIQQNRREFLRPRRIWVPERQIDRFYKKWNYERSPELSSNGYCRHTRHGWY